MSKIIEALEKVRAFSVRTAKTETPVRERVPTAYEAAQRELADVYFAGGTGKARPMPNPTLIRVMDRPRRFPWRWAATLAVFFLLALALFLNKRILINIDVQPGASGPSGAAQPAPAREVPLSPKEFTLSPSLAPASAKTPQELVLVNSPFEGPVYASYAFRTPFNAADYVLEFEARGAKGKEALEVLFTDDSRRSSLSQRPIVPFPMGLGTEWSKTQISVPRSEAFDAQRVVQMRFEIGSQRTGNLSDGTVHIRNVRWRPRA